MSTIESKMQKIFIPCAGTGSRIFPFTKSINKSMVSVGLEPAINKILGKVPKSWEIIIALGYKGELLKEYLNLFFPERNIVYTSVTPYEGSGSSLTHTILSCSEYLQSPFVFCSCDTLVLEEFDILEGNWLGYSVVENSSQYRTLELSNNLVEKINEKKENGSNLAYIGLAGIHDYNIFWDGIEKNRNQKEGEVLGLYYMISNGIEVSSNKFTWYDTGNLESYSKANCYFLPDNPPNILQKENEAIWFFEDTVAKFSSDKNFIKGRIDRAISLQPFVPTVLLKSEHFYSYQKVNGQVLSECINEPIFSSFLRFCSAFWCKKDLQETKSHFYQTCHDFYVTKTQKRVKQYLDKFKLQDEESCINGIGIPAFKVLFDQINFTELCQGMPGRMHGDFHFENVIFDHEIGEFKLIDWRQSFCEIIEYGDIYYDFAKLLHGLIISHKVIHDDLYSYSRIANNISYDFYVPFALINCQTLFFEYLKTNGYSVERVKILTALIFINIAPLHHEPYCHLLFALGKSMLYKNLK